MCQNVLPITEKYFNRWDFPSRENDCVRGVKTNNQSFEASPTLKEPLVNAKAKDVSTPHNQQILSGIPLSSYAELGRTRPPSKPAPVLTKSVNFNQVFPLPSAGATR